MATQYVPKIIAQAKQERGTCITHMVSECLNDDQGIFSSNKQYLGCLNALILHVQMKEME